MLANPFFLFMNFSNMRVAPKLWATILGLLVVMLCANLWVQKSTMATMEQSRQDVQLTEKKITLAQYMRGNVLRTMSEATAQIATSEPHLKTAFEKRLLEARRLTAASIASMEAALITERDRQAFADIRKTFEYIAARRQQAAKELDLNDPIIGSQFAFGDYSRIGDDYNAQIDSFIALQNEQLEALVASSSSALQNRVYTGWLITGVLLLLGVAAAKLLVGNITEPLAQAVAVTNAIGRGDLTQQVVALRKDEFGDLMRAFNAMTARLSQVVTEVRGGVREVSAASTEVANGSQELSTRTEQTAANLEETAASIEQMSSSMSIATDSMQQTNQLAVSAVQSAERGGAVVQQAVRSMEQISSASQKINDIIGVIDGIAFQTNILALNAAVEAARAGEQGRGFAVVAGEVRSLAQRSAEAAKEIKTLITASVQSVNIGSSQVSQAGQVMEEIVHSVRRVTDLVGEVNASAQEQNAGFAQVNQAVANLDQMTQQNAALVEESSAAAKAMSEQAQRLMSAVSIFKVNAVDTDSGVHTLHS